MGGNSLSNLSRVAGLSGGVIRDGGGGTGSGQTRGGVTQPPSKVATTLIGSTQLRLQVTLYPLSAQNIGTMLLVLRDDDRCGLLPDLRHGSRPLGLGDRRTGLIASPVRMREPKPPGSE